MSFARAASVAAAELSFPARARFSSPFPETIPAKLSVTDVQGDSLRTGALHPSASFARQNSRRHLSFGYGIHRCLGARLAELQLQTLIEEMAKRDMEVQFAEAPERIPSCFTHGFHKMMVTISKGT